MNDLQPLRTALTNLAASAPKQVAYLEHLGTAPNADELALALDDALPSRRLSLSTQALAAVDALDRYLDAMSGPGFSDLWTVDAVRERPEWVEIRRLAQVALDALP